jgi:hypothetical protein
MIEIVTSVKEDEWERFLSDCEYATIYHTPYWKKILEETFNYKPYYLFSQDETGKVIGLLPLFYINSKLTGKKLCSLPLSHQCGYIGSEVAFQDIINRSIELGNELCVDHFEIRSPVDYSDFHVKNDYSTYVLELTQPQDTWKRLDKGSVRWAIRKSQKNGVNVTTTEARDDVKKFYELNCITKKELGVPCHSLKLFKDLLSFSRSHARLYIAKYGTEIIGGGIMLYFKNDVIYGYGAADPGSLKLYPYNAFIWKSIEDSCSAGYKSYDFGRASYANGGLIDFKKRWGTVERRLFYSYYKHGKDSLANDRNSIKYKAATGLIKNIPLPVYKKFSDVVFEHFG